MATVNVRRDVQDSFYRYKMPRLTAKVNISIKRSTHGLFMLTN